MPALARDDGDGYSMGVGMVYMFNLIVGTGALTMPFAFSTSGWLVSVGIIVALAIISYITVTFVIEAMAAANAMIHWRAMHHVKRAASRDDVPIRAEPTPHNEELLEHLMQDEIISGSIDEKGERVPLLLTNTVDAISDSAYVDYFNITERLELSRMAAMFFNKWGLQLFFLCLVIYLYGDLAIYVTTVSTSLRDVICTFSNETSIADVDPCWEPVTHLNRADVYRIIVAGFFLVLGPFAFLNFQKTKYMQVLTSLMRWIAFAMMIIIALVILISGKGEGHPNQANIVGIPQLFGVCVYSFMCHHSIPSIITPISRKKRLNFWISLDYGVILVFYLLLSLTGIFTFPKVFNIYTLNFKPSHNATFHHPALGVPFIQYFLALFPVFTLSANFPIICITLRNNLKALCLKENANYSCFINHSLFPLLALFPPLVISLITNNVGFLVGVTGSYAGVVVQYVIPTFLVFQARKHTFKFLGLGISNKHASPFRHSGWLVFIILWTVVCVVLVTVYHVYTGK